MIYDSAVAWSWSRVLDAIENEYVLLPFMAIAPIALIVIFPALAFVPYLIPLLLFHKREEVVGLGPIRDGRPSKPPVSEPETRPRPTKKPVVVWVCLECSVVFVTRGSMIPDCPRCQMPYHALKLTTDEVAAAKEMGLAGASHAWRRVMFPMLWIH